MSSNLTKTISTVALWIVIGAISLRALSVEYGNDLGPLLVVFFVLALAWIGMTTIWKSPEREQTSALHAAQASVLALRQKAKRPAGSRREEQLAVLLELMDDDERELFKERLQQRLLNEDEPSDGELSPTGATLAALLDEEAPRQRRQQ